MFVWNLFNRNLTGLEWDFMVIHRGVEVTKDFSYLRRVGSPDFDDHPSKCLLCGRFNLKIKLCRKNL